MSPLAVRCHAASRAKPGERVNGDRVALWDDARRVGVALADGLGHGVEAGLAAREAVELIAAGAHEDLETLLWRVDRQLAATRGAALTVLSFDKVQRTMEHAGVGNVELCTLPRLAVRPITTAGYFGGRVRKIRVTRHAVAAGDLMVLFTDGISGRFSLDDYRSLDPEQMALAIMTTHAKAHDDATCVAIRIDEAAVLTPP